MGVTNNASIALGFESSVGVLPGSPTAVKYPLRGENFANPLTYEESGEFRDDRLTTPYDLTAEDASGGFDVNMRAEMFDPLIAANFYSSWDRASTRDNAEGAYITAVANTGSAYSIEAAGGEPFVTGQLVYAENFGVAANNGLKHATTGSGDTSLVVTETLTDEGSPPATARLYACGFYGASGDIAAVSDGITASSLDFTTIPAIKVGGWIKIGATGAGNRFATEALNTWARVIAKSATKLTLDNLPSGWTTDAGTGKTIHVFTSEIINIGDGTTKQTLFLQKKMPVTGGTRYMHIYGLHSSLFRLNTTARGRMIARFEYVGIGGDAGGLTATPQVATPSVPRKRNVMTSGRSFVRLHEGGGPFATTVSVPQINFQNNNQLVPTENVTLLGYEDHDAAEAQVQLSGNLNFRTDSLFNKFRGSTETSISAVIAQATGTHLQGYVIEAATGLLTQAGIEFSGPNQIITMPFTFTAHANEGVLTANKQYAWHRLRYYEN